MKAIFPLLVMLLIASCAPVEPPPTTKTHSEYVTSIKDVNLPVEQRQKLWQEMVKIFGIVIEN